MEPPTGVWGFGFGVDPDVRRLSGNARGIQYLEDRRHKKQKGSYHSDNCENADAGHACCQGERRTRSTENRTSDNCSPQERAKSEGPMTRPWKIPSFYLTGLPLPYCLPPEKHKKDKAKSHLDFNGDPGPFGESEADQLIIASRNVFIYAESESSA